MPIFNHSLSLSTWSYACQKSEPETETYHLPEVFMSFFGPDNNAAIDRLQALSVDGTIDTLKNATVPESLWRSFLKEQYRANSRDPKRDFLADPAKRQYFISYGDAGRAYFVDILIPRESHTLNTYNNPVWCIYVNHASIVQQLYNDRTTIDDVIEAYFEWLHSLPKKTRLALCEPRYEAYFDRWLSDDLLSLSDLVSMPWKKLLSLFEQVSSVDPLLLNKKVSVSDLIALDVNETAKLFAKGSLIAHWLRTDKLAMTDILALDRQWRALLFENPNILAKGFNFKQAVSLAELQTFFQAYCVQLLPSLLKKDFAQAIPMYVAMGRNLPVKGTAQQQEALQQAVCALEHGLRVNVLSPAEQLSVHRVLWQCYSALCAHQRHNSLVNKDSVERAFYYGKTLVQRQFESGQFSSQETEAVCQQLATLCVQMSEPVHAVYYWCLAANLVMEQGHERLSTLQQYHAEYQRCLNSPGLSAENHLYALALATSLSPVFFALEQVLPLLTQPDSRQAHLPQWVADIEHGVSRSLTQLTCDIQSLLIKVIENKGSSLPTLNAQYRVDISPAFKKDLYEVLASLPIELKWRALWQILLGSNVLRQLFSPEARGAEMDQAFFMMELQRLTMDAAFSIEACSFTCLDNLAVRFDLIASIERAYPFLYNVLPEAVKKCSNTTTDESLDEEVCGFTDKSYSVTQSPPCSAHRFSSLITPVREYVPDSYGVCLTTPVINGRPLFTPCTSI